MLHSVVCGRNLCTRYYTMSVHRNIFTSISIQKFHLRSACPNKPIAKSKNILFKQHARLSSSRPLKKRFEGGVAGRVSWFPGHMHKAQKQLAKTVRRVDMVLEMRDARIPFTSSNPLLDEIIGSKPRMIVFNKSDLINEGGKKRIRKHFENKENHVIFSSAKSRDNLQVITEAVSSRVDSRFKTVGKCVLIVGIPNVGKSSLINAIRTRAEQRGNRDISGRNQFKKKRGEVARTGGKPGVTRHQTTIQLSQRPPIYAIDSPGVMLPRVPKHSAGNIKQLDGLSEDLGEAGMKLCITGAVADKILGEEIMLEYLLYKLNALNCTEYARTLGLPGNRPVKTIDELYNHMLPNLYRTSRHRGVLLATCSGSKTGSANLTVEGRRVVNADQFEGGEEDAKMTIARRILKLYRGGKLGRVVLDKIPE